jgi:hemerythrin
MGPPDTSTDLRQLGAILDREHARVLELLADVQYLCNRRSYLAAAKVFAEFRQIEEQHLRREEALIAKLAVRGGSPVPLGARAVKEHAELRHLVERTWQALSRNDAEAFEESIVRLSEAVDEHERGEKTDLLPALARAAGDVRAASDELEALAAPDPRGSP